MPPIFHGAQVSKDLLANLAVIGSDLLAYFTLGGLIGRLGGRVERWSLPVAIAVATTRRATLT